MQTAVAESVQMKTRELCEALVALPEFQSIRSRIDSFSGDTNARRLFVQLEEKGSELQQRKEDGLPVTDLENSSYESLRQQFLSEPVGAGFVAAHEEMISLQEGIMKHVAKTFELGRVPDPEDMEGSCGTGCSCDSGCGS